MSFTIHSISTPSTTNRRTKITIASHPIKMQNSNKYLQLTVTGTDTILTHKAMHLTAMTSATKCHPATAKTKDYLRQWLEIQTLSLQSHPVIAPQVDHPITSSAAHIGFHLLMEFREQMRRTHQVHNTGER